MSNIEKFKFNPPLGFNDSTAYPDPVDEENLREMMQRQHNQTRDYINRLTTLLETKGASFIVTSDGKTIEQALKEIAEAQGVRDYKELSNKPSINGVELSGDASLDDLGLTLAIEESTEQALTAAKESGMFDGKDGVDGKNGQDGKDGYTPKKGIDYFDGVNGKDGLNGQNGTDGVGVKSITKTATNGLVDTYTITLTNGNTSTFTVTNGANGQDGKTPVKGIDYFDGQNGQDGKDGYTPQKGIDYFDGKDGVDGKNGQDGKDGYTPKKGIDYFDGVNGKDGLNGQNGTDGVSVSSVKQTTTSGADGGTNVITVTLSNGATSTFSVKNGSAGADGKNGTDATVTSANISKALGYTPANQTDVKQLSEEIADLNESLVSIDLTKYVTKNQGVSNAGKILAVGTNGLLTLVNMPTGGGDVIGTLDGNNNILLSGNLANGTYTIKFENEDGTYTDIGNLVVTSGGTEEPELPYTNLANPSSDEWMDGYRITSSGVIEPTDGQTLVNTIPYVTNDMCRVKGMTNIIVALYKNGTFFGRKTVTTTSTDFSNVVINGDYTEFSTAYDGITSIRFYGVLSGTAEDVIITINEEIV